MLFSMRFTQGYGTAAGDAAAMTRSARAGQQAAPGSWSGWLPHLGTATGTFREPDLVSAWWLLCEPENLICFTFPELRVTCRCVYGISKRTSTAAVLQSCDMVTGIWLS
jgi:hypothetical protein